MNFLFTRKYSYTYYDNIDAAIGRLNNITKKKFNTFSYNITGKRIADNNFRFTHRSILGTINSVFGNYFAILKTTVKEENNKTIIDTVLCPNLSMVIIIYFMAALFLAEVAGVNTLIIGPTIYILPFLAFFILVLIGIIFFMTNSLRRSFEWTMNLSAVS